MHVVQGKQDLVNDITSDSFCHLLLLYDDIKKVAARAELHDYIKALPVLHELKHSRDVRMISSFEDLKFVLHKFLVDLRLLKFGFFNNFDGDDDLGLFVLADPDCAKCAGTELFSNRVRVRDVIDRFEAFNVFEAENTLHVFLEFCRLLGALSLQDFLSVHHRNGLIAPVAIGDCIQIPSLGLGRSLD